MRSLNSLGGKKEQIVNAANHCFSRRDFLKTATAAGAATIIGALGNPVMASQPQATMPTRPFGKTGINVPILSFGGSLDTSLSMLVLRHAFTWGVTYWDTANTYMSGKSEKGIGKYFKKYPQDRTKVFLVTKSDARDSKGMTRLLDRSLKKMKTDYIDLYFVHGIDSINELDKSTKTWADKAKAAGKINLFGFSTHSNMEECMVGAAKLGWIDGIMMTYNYRLMHKDRMKRAVDACVKAGIGLTAMKTQGGGSVKTNTDTELQLAGRFLQKGFTDAQAKLMAVWQNQNIASICSQMPNMTILMSNVAAALNRTALSARDTELLQRYAWETHSDYCAGCTEICEPAIAKTVPIGDVMRCLMYCRSYGDRDYAVTEFKRIAENSRRQLAELDYSPAEQKCPRKIPIGNLMKEAVEELS